MGINRQSRRLGPVGIAVTASVVIHVVVALIALPAMMKAAAAMVVTPLGEQATPKRAEGDAEDQALEPVALEIELPQFVEMIANEEVRNSLRDYLRTTQNEPTDAPDDAMFQSDRNTRAASELPPADDADAPLPTQKGPDIPVVELANREYADGEPAEDRALGDNVPELLDPATSSAATTAVAQEAEPSPLAPRQEATGQETPEPGEDKAVREATSPRSAEDVFAQDPNSDLVVAAERKPIDVVETPKETEIEDSPSERNRPRQGVAETPQETYDPLADHRPPSPFRPALRPGSPEAVPDSFQPQTRKSEQRGTISNRGSDSADAVDTPMGRYMRKVTSAIEREWNRKRVAKSDFVTFGNIRLKFYVDSDGKVKELQITNPGKANPIMQDFTLSAVLEAPIPPIPKNLLSDLTGRRLPVTYDIIIY